MATRNARRRRGRDSSGCLDPLFQRRKRYEAVLRVLGLWEAYARMPREAQRLFCTTKFPDPVLEFDDTFPPAGEQQGRTLRKALERGFREARLEIDGIAAGGGGGGGEILVRDFFAILAALNFTVRDTRDKPGFPEACVAFMREAGPLLEGWYQAHFHDVFDPLHRAVLVPLVARSRLDTRLLTARCQADPTPNGKFVLRTILGSTPPQSRQVPLDGKPRPMYRVGTANEWNGARWLSWTGDALDPAAEGTSSRGEPGEQREGERPVYVQSHALRQLRERANLPGMGPYLEAWLYQSLADPLIVERCGGAGGAVAAGGQQDLLVEYRIREHRIGYLVVTPLEDLIAVRTFKFLTMEHTPEARLLNKQLRLTRRDVDWLGLCDLSTFTQTDLRNDPVLRPLLEACGCAHLFVLAEENTAYTTTPRSPRPSPPS